MWKWDSLSYPKDSQRMSWFSKWSPFKHFQTLNHSFIPWGPLLSCGENATDSCAYSNAEKTSAKTPGTKLRAASWAMAMPSEAKNTKEYTNLIKSVSCSRARQTLIEFQNLNLNIYFVYFIKEFCIFLSASLKDLSGQHWVIGRSPSSQRAIKSLLWLQNASKVWTCLDMLKGPRSSKISQIFKIFQVLQSQLPVEAFDSKRFTASRSLLGEGFAGTVEDSSTATNDMRHPSFHEGSWEWHMRKHSLYHMYHVSEFI